MSILVDAEFEICSAVMVMTSENDMKLGLVKLRERFQSVEFRVIVSTSLRFANS